MRKSTQRISIWFVVAGWLLVSTSLVAAEDVRVPVAGGAEKLKAQLEPLGWRVETQTDGSIELWPPSGPKSVEPATVVDEESDRIATTDLARLQAMLRRTGWEARRQADGSLILQRMATETETSSDEGKDHLGDLYFLLKASGWSATESADGSLLLQPGSHPATVVETIQVPSSDLQGLEETLESRGWHIERDPEGGLVVVPAAEPTAVNADKEAPPGDGLTEEERVAEPVNDDEGALSRVRTWLAEQDRTDVQVGKVRKVNWVYVVSLVDLKEPYALRDQVVVRANDGKVVPLF